MEEKSELNPEVANLQKQLADKIAYSAQVGKDLAESRKELQKVKDELSALKRLHEELEDAHEALRIQFKLAKPKYVWHEGDSKCQPVVRDGKCPTCGWTAKVRDDRNMPVPHPIM